MYTTRRIATLAMQAVLFMVMLGAAALFVVPRLLGWQVVTVMSGSMAPTYPVDSVLAIRDVEATEVRVGDVIAFRTEDDRPLVAHRVVSVEQTPAGLAFVTKGDANDARDAVPVQAADLRGRVVFGVERVGLFSRAVHTPTGFTVLFVLPATIVLAQELRAVRRERRSRSTSPPSTPVDDEWAEIDRLLGISPEATR